MKGSRPAGGTQKKTPYRMSFVSSQGLEPWTH